MWPIKGNEMGKTAKIFLQSKLKITGLAFESLGKMDVRRTKETNVKYPDEVVIIFQTKEARDAVKAAGKHLANEVQCGIRINVPTFMLEDYRLLASVGYMLKSTQTDVRRAIKYNDTSRNLILDVRIDNEWRRVTAAEAREASKTNPAIRSGPRRLDSAGISALLSKPKPSPATGANTVNID